VDEGAELVDAAVGAFVDEPVELLVKVRHLFVV